MQQKRYTYCPLKVSKEIHPGTVNKQEVDEVEPSKTESLSTKVSVEEPTGSTTVVALLTDVENKLEVDEGETSRTEGGFTKGR